MKFISVKPILFNDFFNKFLFQKSYKSQNILSYGNRLIALYYNVSKFKEQLNDGLINLMKKRKASFLIISTRQFSYIIKSLFNKNFNINTIKRFDSIMINNKKNVDIPSDIKEYSIENLNSFFLNYAFDKVYEIEFNNNKQKIIINSNGVISYKNMNYKEFGIYLKLINDAYEKSQK